MSDDDGRSISRSFVLFVGEIGGVLTERRGDGRARTLSVTFGEESDAVAPLAKSMTTATRIACLRRTANMFASEVPGVRARAGSNE